MHGVFKVHPRCSLYLCSVLLLPDTIPLCSLPVAVTAYPRTSPGGRVSFGPWLTPSLWACGETPWEGQSRAAHHVPTGRQSEGRESAVSTTSQDPLRYESLCGERRDPWWSTHLQAHLQTLLPWGPGPFSVCEPLGTVLAHTAAPQLAFVCLCAFLSWWHHTVSTLAVHSAAVTFVLRSSSGPRFSFLWCCVAW